MNEEEVVSLINTLITLEQPEPWCFPEFFLPEFCITESFKIAFIINDKGWFAGKVLYISWKNAVKKNGAFGFK